MNAVSRRRWLLAAGLMVALVTAVLAPSQEVQITKNDRAPAPAGAGASRLAPAVEVPPLAVFTRRIDREFVVLDLFDARQVPGPVAAAPKPSAPPLPFAYVGSLGQAGALKIVLSQGNEIYILSPGERFAGDYRLEGADAEEVRITFVPLQVQQRLPTGVLK